MSARVILVEDHADIASIITFALKNADLDVAHFQNAEDALKAIYNAPPDLLILDVMLPGLSGIQLCKLLKDDVRTKAVPIIFLTAKSEEEDVIGGLGIGAVDYITKPFSPKILVAKVRNILAHSQPPAPDTGILAIEGISINPTTYRVTVDGVEVKLSTLEFQMLQLMMTNPDRVFSRNQLIDAIHGYDYAVTDRSVDVVMVGIRKKLGRYGPRIETVRGVGYRFSK